MVACSETKRLQIKATRQATRERRKSQTIKTYTLKVNNQKLSKQQQEYLRKIFIEAKWFYNFLLQNDISLNYNDVKEILKQYTVKIKKKDVFEDRKLEYLSSSLKRQLHQRICNSIKALSVLKAKHIQSVGRLKFTPQINSIDYPQYKITWRFAGQNKIQIQGCKKAFRVFGYSQLKNVKEYSNLKLVRKADGYYFQITSMEDKTPRKQTNKAIGLDFGIKDTITTSNGDKYKFDFPETKRLKKLQRHESRKLIDKNNKTSKNRLKLRNKINIEFQKINNRKKDATNKLVSKLVKENDIICLQDELVGQWHKGIFGRSVQHSNLGAIKSKLKDLQSTHDIRVIKSEIATTKKCFCRHKNAISLNDRVFKCKKCGFEYDRDIKSAIYILVCGLQQQFTSSGTGDYTCGENVRIIVDGDVKVKINNNQFSMKQEAQSSLAAG